MTKANRWGWIASLVALTAAGLVLFFLLSWLYVRACERV